ncbi:hypothetical protein M0811_03652 [Anaeramoeba ignava]|uniref:Uncharacterized protein n=1 Tax=Anaeramoeba ignava TaxID=1746090 RepID=A0A9Q0L5H9_ANAIG|nr:hypothetical protein M0811_03652 [Anaeramoeba ignava]
MNKNDKFVLFIDVKQNEMKSFYEMKMMIDHKFSESNNNNNENENENNNNNNNNQNEIEIENENLIISKGKSCYVIFIIHLLPNYKKKFNFSFNFEKNWEYSYQDTFTKEVEIPNPNLTESIDYFEELKKFGKLKSICEQMMIDKISKELIERLFCEESGYQKFTFVNHLKKQKLIYLTLEENINEKNVIFVGKRLRADQTHFQKYEKGIFKNTGKKLKIFSKNLENI